VFSAEQKAGTDPLLPALVEGLRLIHAEAAVPVVAIASAVPAVAAEVAVFVAVVATATAAAAAPLLELERKK